MNRPWLLVFVEDPDLRTLIEEIAQEKQLDFHFAAQGEQLLQSVKTLRPMMMIADLSGLNTEWLFKHIAEIANLQPDFPIVAFLASREEGARYRLEHAGCKMVLHKSEVEKKLPEAIENVLKGRF
ncbi:MAG: hypothetical protein A3G87_01720 [Omnitrophica bacterium RIFCSPLOWO2_12_FULL_50_11]|nr:MAG: hypothetical protein A3G87_01720 [Omnitrophica bacterium RIFCSPLOWO2_12_FULL_50_11]